MIPGTHDILMTLPVTNSQNKRKNNNDNLDAASHQSEELLSQKSPPKSVLLIIAPPFMAVNDFKHMLKYTWTPMIGQMKTWGFVATKNTNMQSLSLPTNPPSITLTSCWRMNAQYWMMNFPRSWQTRKKHLWNQSQSTHQWKMVQRPDHQKPQSWVSQKWCDPCLPSILNRNRHHSLRNHAMCDASRYESQPVPGPGTGRTGVTILDTFFCPFKHCTQYKPADKPKDFADRSTLCQHLCEVHKESLCDLDDIQLNSYNLFVCCQCDGYVANLEKLLCSHQLTHIKCRCSRNFPLQ